MYILLWFYLLKIVTTSKWKYFYSVSIHKSCVVYFEKKI